MTSLRPLSLVLLVLVGLLCHSSLANPLLITPERETNANRFARGLGPLPPKKLFQPSRSGARAPSVSPLPARCTSWNANAFILRADRADGSGTIGYVPTPNSFVLPYPGASRSEAGCFVKGGESGGFFYPSIRTNGGGTTNTYVQSPGQITNWSPSHPGYGVIYVSSNPINSPGSGEEATVWSVSPDGDIFITWRDADGSTHIPNLYAVPDAGTDTIFPNFNNPDGYVEVRLFPEPSL